MSEPTESAPTSVFAEALRAMAVTLSEIPAKLEGARVHDTAFGKLFEATEVRDAYHQRLPETEKDLAEATEVIEHFISGLKGGHSIGTRRMPAALPPSIPSIPSMPPVPTLPTALSVPEVPASLPEAPTIAVVPPAPIIPIIPAQSTGAADA